MMERAAATVTLSHGCRVGHERHRTAVVRALTGADEVALEALEAPSSAARVTALLARTVERLGSIQPVGTDVAAALTAGDREALLLQVRRLTFGERLPCVIRCPRCREPMDLDLRVSDLLLPPAGDPPIEHAIDVDAGGASYHIRFRLPTGADLEDSAVVAARQGIDAGAQRILDRCVVDVARDGQAGAALPRELEQEVSQAMATCDPQAELLLRPACPACGAQFETLLDTASFLFTEIGARVPTLFREVHLLARHYHWSEADILAMTPSRRHTYLSLISQEIDARVAR